MMEFETKNLDDVEDYNNSELSDEEESNEEENSEDDGFVNFDTTLNQVKRQTSRFKGIKTDEVVNTVKTTKVNKQNDAKVLKDEYKNDSSDEEDIRNTIGNIPINVYDEYDHVGYDKSGVKIPKPKQDDQIDNFLNKMDDPNYFRTVFDPHTGEKIILNDEELEILNRIRKGKYPDPNFDPYADFIDFFSYEQEQFPVTNHPIPKTRFIPSLSEKRLINKFVIKLRRQRKLPNKEKKDDKLEFNYDLWEKEHEETKWFKRQIFSKKANLPGNIESYNPPAEYLFNDEEKEEWLNQEPEERRLNFMPQKYSSLRKVPQYSNYLQERYERCLELYLKPRTKREKANFRAEDLLPTLPKPSELKPYPTKEALCYIGHSKKVNAISIEKIGQFFASASDDCTIKIWEVLSGKCMRTIELDKPVKCVSWCPNENQRLIIASTDRDVLIINPQLGNRKLIQETDNQFINNEDIENEEDASIKWIKLDEEDKQWEQGVRLIVKHKFEITQITWHNRGDYFAVVMPTGKSKSVAIHHLSKRQSQEPFKKPKGIVQKVLFHPLKPYFFMATQRYIRIYNLVKRELTKKLISTSNQLSSMDLHPKGDNLLVGSYDNRLCWFDLDLSSKPYKTLKYHRDCVRQVAYHKSYPLFASASNDGKITITHGMVYNDLAQNALIVPVKTLLHADESKEPVGGVLDIAFHPNQPWILSSGEDSKIRLFS